MATNYEINYDDQRFQEVEADKKAALNEVDVTYGNMINQSDKYFQQQIDASQDWADKQTQLQQEQTDFAIQEIEQQKENTKKDYLKEQSGAYVDWQKQSNEYGAKAEQDASVGMTGTGYSESSQVSMYNTYQNRVATARESYMRAVQNYDNAITEARLQNNSILAEIAYEALQQQLELSLKGFQYKNQLVLEQANKKLEVDQMYYTRYQDVLQQINTENVLAEEIRQYNETHALQQAQLEEEKRQFDAQMAAKYSSSGSGGGGGSGGSGESTSIKKDNGGDKINSHIQQLQEKGEQVKKKDSSGSSGEPKVNMQSVLNLGYGPISESALARKVADGTVTQTVKNGQIYFTKNFTK